MRFLPSLGAAAVAASLLVAPAFASAGSSAPAAAQGSSVQAKKKPRCKPGQVGRAQFSIPTKPKPCKPGRVGRVNA